MQCVWLFHDPIARRSGCIIYDCYIAVSAWEGGLEKVLHGQLHWELYGNEVYYMALLKKSFMRTLEYCLNYMYSHQGSQ